MFSDSPSIGVGVSSTLIPLCCGVTLVACGDGQGGTGFFEPGHPLSTGVRPGEIGEVIGV